MPGRSAPKARPSRYFYDDLGRHVTVVDQSGNVVNYLCDAVGNQVTQGSPLTLRLFEVLDVEERV